MAVLQKISRDDIMFEIKRNIKAGLLIGVIFSAWKFKSFYQDIIKSASNDYKRILTNQPPEITITISSTYSLKKKGSFTSKVYHLFSSPKSRLVFALLRYFKNFPLFLASFTIIFKYLIRNKIFLNNNLSNSKYSICLLTFILSYICQNTFNIFTWNWSLLLLIRSLYSASSLFSNININIIDIYPFIHGLLGLCLAFNCKYVPSKWWNLVEKCVNEKKDRWYYMLGNHNHGILAPCNIVIHEDNNNKSCLNSFIYDNIRRSIPIFIFFVKFYTLTSVLNINKLLKGNDKIKDKIINILYKQLRNIIGSFGFFMIGVAFAGRIPCLYKWIMIKLHKNNNNYNIIYTNNKAALLLSCVILGRFAILCEDPSRRVDVALSCIWNISQQMIRMIVGLKSDDNGKYHKILSSKQFTSILFAINMAINMFVYCENPKYLKSMERNIIDKYLMQ